MKLFLLLKIVTIIFVTGICLYFVMFYFINPYLHNQKLSVFSNELVNFSIPPHSKEIDKLSEIGLLSGGNLEECDYLVGLLLKTELTPSQLKEFYKSVPNIKFYWLNEPHPQNIGAVNSTGIFSLNNWIEEFKNQNYVIVYIFGPSLTSAIDYRCSGPFGI